MQSAHLMDRAEVCRYFGGSRPINPATLYRGIRQGRYRAVLKAGLQFMLKDEDFKPYQGTKPLEFVISANVHRRHLDTSQRALTAARLVTSKLGDNQYRGGITIEKAAEMLNVSDALVKEAKNVLDKAAPEIVTKVQKGKLRIGAAKEVLDKPKEQQVQALADAKAAAKARRQAAQANREASKAKSTPLSTKNSDEVDLLVNALVGKLKEMKKKDPETAYATTAELIRLLEAADLMGDEEDQEAA